MQMNRYHCLFKPEKEKYLKKDIEDIIDKLKNEVTKIFNSKEYEYHSRILMSELETNNRKYNKRAK